MHRCIPCQGDNPLATLGDNWNFNWELVRILKGAIIKAAKDHERPGDGFPREVVAALMGAHVAREKRTSLFLWDQVGEVVADLTHNNPSTGIANIRPDVVEKTFNGDLEFPGEERRPGKYRFTTILQFQQCLTDGVINQDDYGTLRKLLQSSEISLDVLGANIERGIDRIRLYKIEPSVFNIGNWIWNGNQDPVVIREGINEGLPSYHVKKGYEHGLVMIKQLPKAASELGITLPSYRKHYPSSDVKKDETQFIPLELR